ncbi:MAG: serine/threonine-protein kinase [Cyanobacteria bacterium P01_F01_bin.13]
MTSPTDSSLEFGLPDFSKYGYQLESELGANRAGGRVTYLATQLETQQLVVIKQFQFAKSTANWVNYDALRQEVQVIKDLKHPGIPKYLGVFQADDGFCMVQEYKHAESLAKPRSFSPEAIRQIAIACLEILVYLQSRIPPVIHRDFKPANILVGENLEVYLVDFGFARIGDGEVGVSSVVKGTLGFMPPEQIFNRQLTEASDLYGLGMTLICLLTNTPADEVGALVDVTYRVDFKKLKSDLSPRWVKWLEKMVQPRLSERFENAKIALETIPEHGLRQPEARFSQAGVALAASTRGELLTTAVTLTNSVPETTLKGDWQVVSHGSDPAPVNGNHSWISFSPASFHGNNITTQIQVDTSKLMTGQSYERTLLLKSNAHPSVYSFNLNVQTAPLPFSNKQGTPYGLLVGLLTACWITVWMLTSLAPAYDPLLPEVNNTIMVLALFGNGLGWQLAGWLLHEAKLNSPVARIAMTVGAITVGLVAPLFLLLDVAATDGVTAIVTAGLGMLAGSLLGVISGLTMNQFWQRSIKPRFSIGLSLLTCSLGAGLGLSQGLAISNPWLTFTLIANAVGIATMLTYIPIQRAQAIAFYRRHVEHRLIRP